MIEIEINNLIHLFFRIVCVNAEHGNIKMGVLHGRVFPVNQPNLIFAAFIRKQQKIIRIRINMGEAVFDGVGVNKILQQENIPFRLLIILKNGRSSFPKVLIILDIAEKVIKIFQMNFHLVKFLQLFHTDADLIKIIIPAVMRLSPVYGNFKPGFRIYINHIIADSPMIQKRIGFLFILPVDVFICANAGNPHDILLTSAGKDKGPVCNPFFDNSYIRNFIFPYLESFLNNRQGFLHFLLAKDIKNPAQRFIISFIHCVSP